MLSGTVVAIDVGCHLSSNQQVEGKWIPLKHYMIVRKTFGITASTKKRQEYYLAVFFKLLFRLLTARKATVIMNCNN